MKSHVARVELLQRAVAVIEIGITFPIHEHGPSVRERMRTPINHLPPCDVEHDELDRLSCNIHGLAVQR